MSREAQVWVASLPLSATKTLTAFRVLDKLADAHHTDSDHAWRNVESIATELDCSVRTVQRALRELQDRHLIVVGDQRVLPRTVRTNHAPTAYLLPWRGLPEQPVLVGVTASVTPTEPVDNPARGDRHAALGVTPAVAHRTQEHLELSTEATTDRARDCDHEFSRRAGVCVYCGLRRSAA